MKLSFSTVLCCTLAALCVIAAAIAFPFLPESIPTHWNVDGVADGFMPKATAIFILPALIIALILMLAIGRQISSRKDNVTRSAPAINATVIGTVVALGVIHFSILAVSLAGAVNIPRLGAGCLGLIIAVIGNVCGKTRSNPLIGIRTPWTMASERVWDQTHRAGGRILFAEGVLLMLLALFATVGKPFIVAMASMLIVTVVGLTAYSYVLSTQDKFN